jgi:hypothetical protein
MFVLLKVIAYVQDNVGDAGECQECPEQRGILA